MINHYAFKQEVRTKLFALQNEEFLASCTSSKTRLYKILGEEHPNTVCPWYLDHMVDSANYHALAAIRLCTHRLTIETGGWQGLPLEDRWCPRCSVLGDEMHFLFDCDIHNDLC